ncbi:MAG TPA: hypothetical protein ENN51_06310 [candidate division WOR-3 bacterium]|uniref:DJ-1/PfpI domain-containing protein n=1 Tax=candidate division WOR-3 bacterium TaxID=2052148 RepID=A0A7V0XFB0_UNCW3|nr:hypothetical protein [candidate division WOR-3 bacterium]
MSVFQRLNGYAWVGLLFVVALGRAQVSPSAAPRAIDPGPVPADPAQRVAVFVPPVLFDEHAFIFVYRSLVNAGWYPVLVGADTVIATGFDETMVRPELRRNELTPDRFAGLVLIGGSGAALHWQDSILFAAARAFEQEGKPVAAYGLAVPILARAGLLDGRAAAFFPESEGIPLITDHGARFAFGPVVADGNIITGHGDDAARRFVETIIRALEDRR